jgi:hypothetical protein
MNHRALVVGEVGQRQVLLAGLEVDLHGVTLREGPAPRVLPGQPDVVPSSSSDPNASVSPSAQSIVPVS